MARLHVPECCPELSLSGWRAMRSPGLRRRAPREARNFDRQAFWMAAAEAIERNYAADHPNHVVLYGSAWASEGPSGTLLLPKGVPDQGRWNDILRQLRGLANQRRPDIIDFTDRKMYEIKPAGSDEAAGTGQGQSPIAILNAIIRQEGGQSWDPNACDWVPKHILPYPTDFTRCVCTGETDQNAAKGLILYRVYRKLSDEEQKEAKRQKAVLTDFVTELEQDHRPRVTAELQRVAPQFESDTELWILYPIELWEATLRMLETDARPLPGTIDIRRYPLMAANAAMASAAVTPFSSAVRMVCTEKVLIVLVGAAACLVVVGAVMLLPELAAGGAALTAAEAAVTGATLAEEGVVISLQAFRAARAAPVVVATAKEISSAAAVLLVVASTRQAAAATPAVVTDVSAVRAVDANDIPAYYEFSLGREITYNGERYRIAGRARVAG